MFFFKEDGKIKCPEFVVVKLVLTHYGKKQSTVLENNVPKRIFWLKGGEITEEQKELINEDFHTVICIICLMFLAVKHGELSMTCHTHEEDEKCTEIFGSTKAWSPWHV